MNWLLISVGIIFLVCMIVGAVRGAIRIAVTFGATVATIVIVIFLTPFVSKAIFKFTPADDMIERTVVQAMKSALTSGEAEDVGLSEDKVKEILANAGITEEMLEAAGISVADIIEGKVSGEDLKEFGVSPDVLNGIQNGSGGSIEDQILDAEIPRQTQITAIEKADLPKVFKELLLDNNNNEVYKNLGVKTFAEYVSKYLAKIIVGLVSFLGTFLIVTILVRSIVFALDFVSDLPVLGALNRLAGAGVGALTALVVVWIIFIVLTLMYTTAVGKDMFALIGESKILSFLYDNNYILKLVTKFR